MNEIIYNHTLLPNKKYLIFLNLKLNLKSVLEKKITHYT